MTLDRFCLCLEKDCAVSPGAHVLVAVSGGADSTALLCFFDQARSAYPLSLSCAHVEHGIRGGESLEDLAFVRALCEKKGIPFYAESVDAPGYARAHGCGMEDAARTLRYTFLQKTASKIGADVIALAHHMGDQAETVLLHAARGSDVRGLCAMRMRSGSLIRPLLGCTSGELGAFLDSIGQGWREDVSNADVAYARNRIRRDALPAMEAAFPGAGDALCRLARAAQRDEDFFDRAVDGLALRMMPLAGGAAVPRAQIESLHPALLSRVIVRLIEAAGIKRQSARTIEAIMQAAESGGVVNLTEGAHASCGEKYLCVMREETEIPPAALNVPGVTETLFGRFEIYEAAKGETGDGKTSQRVPRRLLEGACVSARKEGDVMIPFGRKSPVKLKKLMIDAGIERAMRGSVPIVRAESGEILFALGLRPAEACRGAQEEQQMMIRFCGAWPQADEI